VRSTKKQQSNNKQAIGLPCSSAIFAKAISDETGGVVVLQEPPDKSDRARLFLSWLKSFISFPQDLYMIREKLRLKSDKMAVF
jgi:hypothetical protein